MNFPRLGADDWSTLLHCGESRSGALHCCCGAAECVRSLILGALSILKGAVPGRARGLGHMAPTYLCREPGIVAPAARAAPHFSMAESDTSSTLKAELRRAALGRRDALPAAERMAAAQTIAERGLPVDVAPGAVVSGFSPLKSE